MNKTPKLLKASTGWPIWKQNQKYILSYLEKWSWELMSVSFSPKISPKFPCGHFFITKQITDSAAKVDLLLQNTRRTSLLLNIWARARVSVCKSQEESILIIEWFPAGKHIPKPTCTHVCPRLHSKTLIYSASGVFQFKWGLLLCYYVHLYLVYKLFSHWFHAVVCYLRRTSCSSHKFQDVCEHRCMES